MNVNGFIKAAAGVMIVLSAACAVKKTVVVDILKPARETFPSYTNVAITDRSKLDSLSFNTVYPSNLLTSRFRAIPNFLGSDVLSSFYDGMENFQRVRLSEINPLPIVPRAKDYKAPALDTLTLKRIASENPSLEALLTLDGLKYEIYTDGNVYRDQLLLSSGKAIDIPIFSSEYSYKVFTFWRLYDLKTRSVVMERSFSEELPFYYDGYSMYDKKGYGNNEQGWQRAAAYTGLRFADTYIPSWEAQERYLFPGDTQQLLEASDNAELGRWLDAAEKWELYKSQHRLSKGNKAKVNYNLAVAYEVLGKVTYARELCEEAYALTNNKFYLDYARKLKIREADIELLDKQFTGQ